MQPYLQYSPEKGESLRAGGVCDFAAKERIKSHNFYPY